MHKIVQNSTSDADLLGRGVLKKTLGHPWILGIDPCAGTSKENDGDKLMMGEV